MVPVTVKGRTASLSIRAMVASEQPVRAGVPAFSSDVVSPTTIRRWCRLGHLHAFQVGRGAAIRIPAAELRALLRRLEDASG